MLSWCLYDNLIHGVNEFLNKLFKEGLKMKSLKNTDTTGNTTVDANLCDDEVVSKRTRPPIKRGRRAPELTNESEKETKATTVDNLIELSLKKITTKAEAESPAESPAESTAEPTTDSTNTNQHVFEGESEKHDAESIDSINNITINNNKESSNTEVLMERSIMKPLCDTDNQEDQDIKTKNTKIQSTKIKDGIRKALFIAAPVLISFSGLYFYNLNSSVDSSDQAVNKQSVNTKFSSDNADPISGRDTSALNESEGGSDNKINTKNYNESEGNDVVEPVLPSNKIESISKTFNVANSSAHDQQSNESLVFDNNSNGKEFIQKGVDVFQQKIKFIEQKNIELEQSLSIEKRRHSDDLSDKDKIIGVFQKQINEKDLKINDLTNEVSASKEALTNASAKLPQLELTLKKKEDEVMLTQSTISQLGKEKAKLSDENSRLASENEDLMTKNGQLTIELSKLRKEFRGGVDSGSSELKTGTSSESDAKLSDKNEKKSKAEKGLKSKPESSNVLSKLKIIGVTDNIVVAINGDSPLTIKLGASWKGVEFKSFDVAKGIVSTSAGDITVGQ